MDTFFDTRFALHGSSTQYARDRTFLTEHIKLDIEVDISKKSLYCTAFLYIRSINNGVKSIKLDAVDMKVSAVYVDDERATFDYDSKTITIHLKKALSSGKQAVLKIEYDVIDPKLGVYFVTPDRYYPKKPVQVWSHCEPQDARNWFPCFDDPNEKTTTEMLLTVDEEFVGLSNGVLLETTHNKKNKKKTYHWKMNFPHSSYLVMFAVGRFAEIKGEWDGIECYYYFEKGREEDAKRAFGKTPKMLQFFSEKTGYRYPYERYSQVAVTDFIFGGMEHTTFTTQTDGALHDERAVAESWADGLVAHELAHQWFGDLITCKDWSHAWLNESFATYFDALFTEYDRGEEEFLYQIYKNAQAYFVEDRDRYRRPISTNVFTRPGDLFDRHLYEKGSVVLHMLRNVLGEDLFWRSINLYVQKNANRAAETLDLINCIEEATGRNMKKFFDQWIFGAGHPELRVSYFWDEKKSSACVRVVQKQKIDGETPLFTLPLEISVITKKGEKTFNEVLDKKNQLFKFKMNEKPVDVRVDTKNFLLKKIEFIKPRDMWFYQLENEKNVIGKIYATQEVAKSGSERATEALENVFIKEKFWGNQCEIAYVLGMMRTQTAFEALKRCIEHCKHVKSERAVVEALGEYKNEETIEIMKKFLADKKSYIVPAEAVRSLGKTKNMKVLPLIKKSLELESWNDIIKSSAVEGLVQLQDESVLDIVMKYCQKGHPWRTRATALRLLPEIGRGREDVFSLLVESTKDDFSLIKIAAVFALGVYGDERAVPVLEGIVKQKVDERVKRAAEEAIRKIFAWVESDSEVEKLKNENEILRAKLEEFGK